MKTIIYTLLMFICAIPIMAQEPSSATEPPRIAPTAGPYGGGTHGPITYDPSGNIVVIGSDYYLYDPMGRLKTASVNRPDQTGAQVHGYEYDVYGNRIVRDGAAYAASTASNRLTSFGAQYDVAGNLVQWQPPGSAHVRTYTYDALNMLTKETVAGRVVTHVYTADDERLWQFDTTATVSHWTVRDLGGKVLRDFVDGNTGWSLFREYIYRDGQLLAANTAAGTQHYSLDHLGSPRLVTDGSRNKVFQHHYLPFGEEWTIGGDPVDGSTLRFTGHERDDDRQGEPAGTLDYMHARHYSSNLGRFLSADPVIGAAGIPQSWNRYAYVLNRPLTLIDPAGMYPCDIKTPTGIIIAECVSAGLVDDTSQGDRDLGQMLYDTWLAIEGRIAMANEDGARSHNNAVLDHMGYHNYIECFVAGDCMSGEEWAREMAGQMPFVGGNVNKLAKADDLIRGSLRRSASYRSELGQETVKNLEKLASNGKTPGHIRKAARGMLKLIRDAERLLEMGNKK